MRGVAATIELELITYLQGMHHGSRKAVGIFSTGEVEAVYMPRIPPLVEGGGRLVVLQATDYSTVYHHLREIMLLEYGTAK